MLHKFVDFNGVMVLVVSVDGQTNGADEATVLAVGVDTHEGGILTVRMTVVGFYEVFEALCKLLDVALN